MTATLPDDRATHTALDPHERALRQIVRRLTAQGIELEPADVRWWWATIKNWPTGIDRCA
jgi:hypothetical protein